MDLRGMAPLLIYDDRCRLCSWFARAANRLAGGGLALVGHHTDEGRRAGSVLGPGAAEVFWFVDGRAACGGRAGLLPLAREIAWRRRRSPAAGGGGGACGASCSGPGAVLVRSASLLTRSRRVPL